MPTVIVAEDDQLLRRLYNKVLTHAGYQAVLAESCAETMSCLSEVVPDFILLDMTMADGSGLPILHHIRQTEKFRNTRVIVITGNKQYERRVIDSGADFFLSKPVSARALTETLSRFTPQRATV